MDGTDRVVLVKDDLGLPNGLSFDQTSQHLCWADAGESNHSSKKKKEDNVGHMGLQQIGRNS